MKRMILFFGVMMIILAVCLSGCSAQKNIVITDTNTGETVLEFSSKEHQDEAAALTNAMNGLEETVARVDNLQKYSVHLIDPKESRYDIWYYLYVDNDNNDTYVQFDMEKMKDYSDKVNEFFDGKIRKSPNLTAKEFSAILKIQ